MAENILKCAYSHDEKFTMKDSHDDNIHNEKVSPAIKRSFRSFRPLEGAIKKNRFHCGNDNENKGFQDPLVPSGHSPHAGAVLRLSKGETNREALFIPIR